MKAHDCTEPSKCSCAGGDTGGHDVDCDLRFSP